VQRGSKETGGLVQCVSHPGHRPAIPAVLACVLMMILPFGCCWCSLWSWQSWGRVDVWRGPPELPLGVGVFCVSLRVFVWSTQPLLCMRFIHRCSRIVCG
jgi:hypothetical protein